MAWYDVTYACGHKGQVQLVGANKDREWRLMRAESESCPECKSKEYAEQALKDTQAGRELGFPDLRGSEKQIIWAAKIRMNFFTEFNAFIEKARSRYAESVESKTLEEKESYSQSMAFANMIADHIIQNQTRAGWWIENRTEVLMVRTYLLVYYEIYKSEIDRNVTEEEEQGNAVSESAKEEATVRPEKAIKPGIVEIVITKIPGKEKSVLAARYVKDEDFRSVVKEYAMIWDRDKREWSCNIGVFRGPVMDRAAELINALLRAGFTVRCYEMDALKMAADGTFSPERKNWISINQNGEFRIFVHGDEALYQKARSIKNSRWDYANKEVLVPMSKLNDVQEFARLMDYEFSPRAIEAIKKAEEEQAKASVVNVRVPEPVEQKDGLQEILNSSREILPDLLEEQVKTTNELL